MTKTNWRRAATFIIGSIFTGILGLIAACTPLITGIIHEVLNAPPPPVITSAVPNIEPVEVPISQQGPVDVDTPPVVTVEGGGPRETGETPTTSDQGY